MSNQTISQNLQKVLNRHGYSFQYAVIKQFVTLFDEKKSSWNFEVTEFPVTVHDTGTRIDFILKYSIDGKEHPIFLLVECKRANPSHSNWCFAKAPYVRRGYRGHHFLVDRLKRIAMNSFLSDATRIRLDDAYHVAVELKTDAKGDPSGKGTGQIEDAATQVCRGLNGMLEFFYQNYEILQGEDEILLIPVIVTTANLFTTDVDLSLASLETGELEVPEKSMKDAVLVPYQYHLSPGIKASNSAQKDLPNGLGEILYQEYARTITIVNATHIEEFINWIYLHLSDIFDL